MQLSCLFFIGITSSGRRFLASAATFAHVSVVFALHVVFRTCHDHYWYVRGPVSAIDAFCYGNSSQQYRYSAFFRLIPSRTFSLLHDRARPSPTLSSRDVLGRGLQ